MNKGDDGLTPQNLKNKGGESWCTDDKRLLSNLLLKLCMETNYHMVLIAYKQHIKSKYAL